MEASSNIAGKAVGDFAKLFKDFNVIGFVLGLLVANGVAEIAQAFIDGVIMPTAQPLLNKVSSQNAEIRLGGFILHLEKFLGAIFKFLVLAVVIFILMQVGVKMSRPITWVRIEEVKDGLKM